MIVFLVVGFPPNIAMSHSMKKILIEILLIAEEVVAEEESNPLEYTLSLRTM